MAHRVSLLDRKGLLQPLCVPGGRPVHCGHQRRLGLGAGGLTQPLQRIRGRRAAQAKGWLEEAAYLWRARFPVVHRGGRDVASVLACLTC